MHGEREAKERSVAFVLEHRVDVDLLDAVDMAGKQRRDLLACTLGRLFTNSTDARTFRAFP